MTEVIPAIITKDIQELKRKIALVEPYVKWVQIDVSDGVFAPNITWNNPLDLKSFAVSVLLEVHLMVADPDRQVDDWISSGARRIIFHIDQLEREEVAKILKKAQSKGVDMGVALKPETDLGLIKSLASEVKLVLLLAVSPGFSGQRFNETVLEKIKILNRDCPDVIIEVDGGINLETGKKCLEAGADILVSGSYIFDSGNIKESIEELKELQPR